MRSEFDSNDRFGAGRHLVRRERRGRRYATAERRASAPWRPAYRTLRLTRRFSAVPERIFEAWLDPRFAARWLFATASRPIAHVEIDARVDGAFRFVDRHRSDITEYTGQYVEIIPNRRLAFTLVLPCAQRPVTRVTVEIAPLGRGSRLTLIHENVPAERASDIDGRWTGVLYGLGVTLESDVGHAIRKPPVE
jgi:uncharacterized protein YndB with AHSA1/START domain